MSVPLDVWSCWRSEWGNELRGMGSSETLTAVQSVGVCFRARRVERGRRMSVWSAAVRVAAVHSLDLDVCVLCDARCACECHGEAVWDHRELCHVPCQKSWPVRGVRGNDLASPCDFRSIFIDMKVGGERATALLRCIVPLIADAERLSLIHI